MVAIGCRECLWALWAIQAAAREFALDTALGYGERAIRFDGDRVEII